MVQSLRTMKMERTRQAIFTAGMELFADRGFDAVTVADIAARADVAPRTFHRYFPDKAELLFTGDAQLRQALQTALQDEPPVGGVPAQVLALLEAVCQPLADHHAELVVREHLLQQVSALRARDLAKQFALQQMVAEHLAAQLGVPVDTDVRPRWWAGVAFATFTAAYQTWLTRGGTLSSHMQSAADQLHQHVPGPDPAATEAAPTCGM